MRTLPVLSILLCLCLLTGCEPGTTAPPALAPFFPTVTPTIMPSPTPTREDEIVIPFESLAIGGLIRGVPDGIDEPEMATDFGPYTLDEYESLIGQGPFTFLITSLEEAMSLPTWVPSEVQSAIESVDFEQDVIVAYFMGPSGGAADGYIYRIATSTLETITIYTVVRQATSASVDFSFPGHIVRIRRQDVPFPLSAGVEIQLETETVMVN